MQKVNRNHSGFWSKALETKWGMECVCFCARSVVASAYSNRSVISKDGVSYYPQTQFSGDTLKL